MKSFRVSTDTCTCVVRIPRRVRLESREVEDRMIEFCNTVGKLNKGVWTYHQAIDPYTGQEIGGFVSKARDRKAVHNQFAAMYRGFVGEKVTISFALYPRTYV